MPDNAQEKMQSEVGTMRSVGVYQWFLHRSVSGGYHAAMRAVSEASEKLSETTPNGRDWRSPGAPQFMPPKQRTSEKAPESQNPGLERQLKCREMLREKGYRPLNECDGPKAAVDSHLVFYGGPRGVVIAQYWSDGSGVATYADWPLGHTWKELERIISPSVKCDGNHGLPICADPQCWQTPDPVSEAFDMPDPRLDRLEQERDALLKAARAWEFARKEGGISHADFFEAAWKATADALALVHSAGTPATSAARREMTDEEAETRGARLSAELLMKRDREHKDRWQTLSGSYTNKGVARRALRILIDGEL